MAITWFEDSGDLKLPDVKRTITNKGVILFVLPTIYERFLKGYTYSSTEINSLFNDNGTVEINSTPKDDSSPGGPYYLAEKPNVEARYARWLGPSKSNDKQVAYVITLHLFYVKESEGEGGGPIHYAL